MTFLQLCQRVHLWTRQGNALPGTVPTTTVGQTGTLAETVIHVTQAWIDIQNALPLACVISQDSHAITSGTRTILLSAISPTAIEVLPMFDPCRFVLCYLTATGVSDSTPVRYVPYQQWRGYFDLGTRATGKPAWWTMRPGNTIELDPTPDASYTLLWDVKNTPQTFSADADDPANYPATNTGLQAPYHDAIVWKAVEYYAETRGDAVMMAMAAKKYAEAYTRIANKYLPEVQW